MLELALPLINLVCTQDCFMSDGIYFSLIQIL